MSPLRAEPPPCNTMLTSIASAPHTPAREMRRASRVALAIAIASAIVFAPLARAERDARRRRRARRRDDPVLSFGQRCVPGETLESLDGPESRAAAAVGDEFIVPGSIWAQALDEGEEVVARTGAGEEGDRGERGKVFAPGAEARDGRDAARADVGTGARDGREWTV